MKLSELKKEIPFQWKIQTKPKDNKKWCCVAYIDARDAMDLLDEVCWQENWQSEFYEVRGTMFCRVGIIIDGKLVFKSDAGSKPDESSGDDAVVKGEPSDAFKRACVQWGIWRFLYSKDMVWISLEEYEANKFKITEFCNSKKSGNTNYTPKAKRYSEDEIQAKFNRFAVDLKNCETLESLKTCFFEVVKAKSILGEMYYLSLATLKDDKKLSIESKI